MAEGVVDAETALLSEADQLFELAGLLQSAVMIAEKVGLSLISIQLFDAINECQREIGHRQREVFRTDRGA